jgi:choline dehydrogenase-like flavoprotein
VRASLFALASDFARGSSARLLLDDLEIDTMISREGAYGGHHIGTARMAASPRDGVVDENCRVFGMENLFVAGSAVFPTSGQANPTLTIVALALRLKEAVLF